MEQLKHFPPLSDEIMQTLYKASAKKEFATGEYLIKEHEKGNSFFIIEKGEVEIFKGNVPVGVIHKGDILGESALNGGTRNASAKANTPVEAIEVSVDTLSKTLSKEQLLAIKSAIFERILEKLSKVNKLATFMIRQHFEDEKARSLMSRFIIFVLILVFLYVFAIQSVTILKLTVISSSVISVPILIICCLAMVSMMKNSRYPLKTYGFTLENWPRVVVESILWTIPVLLALILCKWILITVIPAFSSVTLFDISPALNEGAGDVSPAVAALLVLAYTLFVPVQEIIYRGAMQSSLQLFLSGKNKTILAILVSNIPFSMIHFHLSVILVVTTYILGVFWGYMYARQKSLLGVSISHFLVGLFAFFILGLQDVLVF
ncbi:MAG: cyclic nucleotide-binding domain-containing protein [Verrucomicrobia bacterium]|nr:cyclic nucleotide-binding domain-containing protein [Verrucomicrobiota bacterium]